jgi:hypothetical protein
MSDPRPPIHPAPGDWPEVRDHHKEIIERQRAALRKAREAVDSLGDTALANTSSDCPAYASLEDEIEDALLAIDAALKENGE